MAVHVILGEHQIYHQLHFCGRRCCSGLNTSASLHFRRGFRSSSINHVGAIARPRTSDNFEGLEENLEKVARMQHGGDCSDGYAALLRRCANGRALGEGKRVHAHILRTGYGKDTYLCNLLVQMYVKCGSLEEARAVFDAIPRRNVFSWNSMITAYAQKGHDMEALHLYHKMDSDNVPPNGFIFASALAACSSLGSLAEGKAIHARICSSKLEPDVVVRNALVTMYAKSGDLENARRLFDEMQQRNLVSWNAMISAYVQQEHPREGLDLYYQMQLQPNSFIFASALSACSMLEALEEGKAIHERIISSRLKPDIVVQNALVNMYAKCGSLDEARRAFEEMQRRDVYTWTAMITGYAQGGHNAEARELYRRMSWEHVEPNSVTFSSVLAACSTLEEGEAVQEHITACSFQSDPVVQTALIGMYGKYGSIEDARRVFESMAKKDDVVSWSSMLSAYAQNSFATEAIQVFREMVSEGIEPNLITFSSILSACGSSGALQEGKAVHAHLDASGFKQDDTVQNALVSMYCKCGCHEDARKVFDRIQGKDLLTWTSMIAAYVQHGLGKEALELYHRMDVEPDEFTFASIVGACSSLGDLEEGKAIHARVSPRELGCDVLGTALVNMYVKCGSVADARKLFDRLQVNNVYAWTVMVGAYAQNGDPVEALKLFRNMDLEGVEPNGVTFASVLPACSTPKAMEVGKGLHARIVATGYESDPVVETALINMYSKCGSLKDARRVFEQVQDKEVYTWNAMISGYNQQGYPDEALTVYKRMLSEEDEQPNAYSFALALNACSNLGALEEGKAVHERVLSSGIQLDFVQNALVTMYAKCGSTEDARSVFEEIGQKNVVSWTAMIATYSQNGFAQEALEVYRKMDTEPDDITYACVLNACATLGSLEDGREVHARIVANDVNSDYVRTALLNMYAKCGAMADARRVFDKMSLRDTVSWNAMMTAYAQHGHFSEVVELYRQMGLDGVDPDGITFISILISCSQSGQLGEAHYYFRILSSDHGISLMSEHYLCIIDLFGRAGHLADAEELIKCMTCEPDAVAWMTMLSACKNHGDEDRGKRAAEHVFELDPEDTAPYILLSNMYALTGKEGEVAKLRRIMKSKRLKKVPPGSSFIELDFIGDVSHHPKPDPELDAI